MKKEGYFTIGELAKVMGINPKSLRYYDKIGVLRPAYVDYDTGYRYYTSAQIGVLSAIRICIDLGIPLQEFQTYFVDGNIETTRFLEDAARVSYEKIKALEESLQFIKRLKLQVNHADLIKDNCGLIEYSLGERIYLTKAISAEISTQNFNKILGELHVEALERGLSPDLNFGRMAIYEGLNRTGFYAFINIKNTDAGKNIVRIQPSAYKALHITEPQIEKVEEIFETEFCAMKNSDCEKIIVLESEMISSHYNVEVPEYELCMTKVGRVYE